MFFAFFTSFVSSALAFVRRGAKIVFADSSKDNPNIDADKIEALITPKTKVIVPVHYAGVACDMDKIMAIADRHHLLVVEDAAQAVDSYYKGRPLGGIGHFGCFSFHETKNITSGGEGGLLIINDEKYVRRAEIIWEKGTNSAFLWAQLENLEMIQSRRKHLWNMYYEGLKELSAQSFFRLPDIPDYATNNGHMFYLVCRSLEERTALISYLREHDVLAVFQYLSLHKSEYYLNHGGVPSELPYCDGYADCLVRLPMFYDLEDETVQLILDAIIAFFSTKE